jgi:ABC-type transport system involved in cytochrome bd biosynthesis fused ATPase/permease subunit
LLEDPTAGLSPLQVDLFQRNLDVFQNTTVLIATHHAQLLEKMDRVIVFKEGKIVYDGNYKTLNQNL